jgi:hypothetical protein
MKMKFWTILPAIPLMLVFVFMSSMDIQKGNDIPDDVEKILSNSCYGCHTTGARAEDAVKALDFKKWADLKPSKKVGALNDINEVVSEGQMPPDKFVKKYPDKGLSDTDKEMILKWTKKEISKLME